MFLKQCSLVQPCTAGFGWHGRQWVKQNMYVMKGEKTTVFDSRINNYETMYYSISFFPDSVLTNEI